MTEPNSQVKDYFELLKPRVMTLVVFTGLIGLLLAPGKVHPFIAIVATFCIALGSGAAGAINMWYERDVDRIMERTKNRPLPLGKINPDNALEYGVVMAGASVMIMYFATNIIAAALLLLAILFYVFIYTIWLKRRTPQNIVIGGAAGAFPPMIGWAAVNGQVSLESFVLFLIIFLWTPPHFWALALYKSDDYKKVGIPMLPVVAGRATTQKQILLYTVILVLSSILPFLLGMVSYVYLVASIILGIGFLKNSYSLFRKYSEKLARKTFKFSLLYLSVLFLMMLIDKVVFSYAFT